MSYRPFADLGGVKDDRPVEPEPDGATFHADWEPRAMALTVAMGATGLWNIDQSRSARETLADHSNLGYYQVWLAALEERSEPPAFWRSRLPCPRRCFGPRTWLLFCGAAPHPCGQVRRRHVLA